MAITRAKRQKMEKLIYDTFSALDPSSINTDKYKKKFKDMSDAQFDAFFKNLFKEPNQYLILDTVDYENDVKIENLQKAADLLNVELYEFIAMPFANNDINNPVVSSFKIPTGFAHIKRMQQTLNKKNSTSIDIHTRSPLTGQVAREDKNSRNSDVENFSLITINALNTAREMNGPRADDMVMKNQMYQAIAQNGFVSLDDLDDDVANKTTLNTIDVFYIGSGLKTDLVTKGMTLIKD